MNPFQSKPIAPKRDLKNNRKKFCINVETKYFCLKCKELGEKQYPFISYESFSAHYTREHLRSGRFQSKPIVPKRDIKNDRKKFYINVETKYFCLKCKELGEKQYPFISYKSFSRHFTTKHLRGGRFECPNCQKVMTTKEGFDKHYTKCQFVDISERYHCYSKTCNWTSKSWAQRQRHYVTDHKDEEEDLDDSGNHKLCEALCHMIATNRQKKKAEPLYKMYEKAFKPEQPGRKCCVYVFLDASLLSKLSKKVRDDSDESQMSGSDDESEYVDSDDLIDSITNNGCTLAEFVEAIIYVGEGLPGRLLTHLNVYKFDDEKKGNPVLKQRIAKIREKGYGVIPFKLVDYVTKDQARCVESLIIDALNVKRLTNRAIGFRKTLSECCGKAFNDQKNSEILGTFLCRKFWKEFRASVTDLDANQLFRQKNFLRNEEQEIQMECDGKIAKDLNEQHPELDILFLRTKRISKRSPPKSAPKRQPNIDRNSVPKRQPKRNQIYDQRKR